MTIKTRTELEAVFADNETLDITPEDIRDLVDSLGVGGVLFGSGDQAVSTTAAPFTAFTGSNSNGVVADPAAGTLTIPAGGDGFYQVVFVCSMALPASGRLQLRLRKNGANTPFRTGQINVTAGEDQQFVVLGSGNLVAGDIVDCTIQANGSATVTVESAQFQIDR